MVAYPEVDQGRFVRVTCVPWDVDAACAELRALGVAAREPIVTGYGMKQVYLKDPDGYELCLQQPVDVPHA